jgi:hypothetical protein
MIKGCWLGRVVSTRIKAKFVETQVKITRLHNQRPGKRAKIAPQ